MIHNLEGTARKVVLAACIPTNGGDGNGCDEQRGMIYDLDYYEMNND